MHGPVCSDVAWPTLTLISTLALHSWNACLYLQGVWYFLSVAASGSMYYTCTCFWGTLANKPRTRESCAFPSHRWFIRCTRIVRCLYIHCANPVSDIQTPLSTPDVQARATLHVYMLLAHNVGDRISIQTQAVDVHARMIDLSAYLCLRTFTIDKHPPVSAVYFRMLPWSACIHLFTYFAIDKHTPPSAGYFTCSHDLHAYAWLHTLPWTNTLRSHDLRYMLSWSACILCHRQTHSAITSGGTCAHDMYAYFAIDKHTPLSRVEVHALMICMHTLP